MISLRVVDNALGKTIIAAFAVWGMICAGSVIFTAIMIVRSIAR